MCVKENKSVCVVLVGGEYDGLSQSIGDGISRLPLPVVVTPCVCVG